MRSTVGYKGEYTGLMVCSAVCLLLLPEAGKVVFKSGVFVSYDAHVASEVLQTDFIHNAVQKWWRSGEGV